LKIDAILFDLDNTLILFDEKKYFREYSSRLYQYFKEFLSENEFVQKLISSLRVMSDNDGKVTNADFYINDFSKRMSLDKEILWQKYEDFYATEFEKLEYLMTPVKSVPEIFKTISEKSLKIVIASNPMFPENIQRLRLQWAGLDGTPFDLITHAYNSTFCKPNLNYYLEICEKIGTKPENCLMVGNDILNDMIAGKIGMNTFLTVDGKDIEVEISRQLVEKGNFDLPKPDFTGKLLDLLKILNIE